MQLEIYLKNILLVNNRLILTKTKAFQEIERLLFYWWSHLDSNQGPPDYESGALTS